MATIGRIHSKESFGTVDGPGIRYVLFLQGCPMRCLFCHNPDTWDPTAGEEITPEEIIAEYNKNRAFYSHGGITVTGGEPLLQVDFLTELFTLAKNEGIHTCIDTSGITFNPENEAYVAKLDRLLEKVDLVMLDIKHIDTEAHKKLTAHGNENILAFAKRIIDRAAQYGIDKSDIIIDPLTMTISTADNGALPTLRALDVLPYHTMGVNKYHELGIEYPLEGMKALPLAEAVKAKKYILEGVKETRK